MPTKEQRRKAAAEQCDRMTDDEIRALLARPRLTKTLRTVAANKLSWRTHQRQVAEMRRREEQPRSMDLDALWTAATTDTGTWEQQEAAEEWKRRSLASHTALTRAEKQRWKVDREAARQAIEHWSTEDLLAFRPTKDTTRLEIEAVWCELWRRKKLIERKCKKLWDDAGRSRPQRLEDAPYAEAAPLKIVSR
jgi:hypothetical protein